MFQFNKERAYKQLSSPIRNSVPKGEKCAFCYEDILPGQMVSVSISGKCFHVSCMKALYKLNGS